MNVQIKIKAETQITEFEAVESIKKILQEMLPYMIDNVKVEVLVDGLPY